MFVISDGGHENPRGCLTEPSAGIDRTSVRANQRRRPEGRVRTRQPRQLNGALIPRIGTVYPGEEIGVFQY